MKHLTLPLATLSLALATAACGGASTDTADMPDEAAGGAAGEAAGSGEGLTETSSSGSEQARAAVAEAPAGVVIPQRFHGTYDSDGADCDRQAEMYLEVEPQAVQFYESSGRVTSVEVAGEKLYVSFAMSGEGESFSRAFEMEMVGGGDTLSTVTEGMAEAALRQRCS